MTQDKHEPVYKIIRTKCRRRFWTSREFALKFGCIKFTNRVREMIAAGEKFQTGPVTIRGRQYKGYQYIGKKAA